MQQQPPYPKAQTYIRAFTNGVTQPHLIACDDGLSYVVKFKGNGVGRHVLIKELVVSMVADALGFSHKRGSAVEVGQTFLSGQPALNGLEPGLQFGSPNLGNPFPFGDVHIPNLRNKEELPQVIVLDTLFCNRDRHPDNILILYDDGKQDEGCRFFLVDHSHVLGHDRWGESVLRELIGDHELYVRDVGFNHTSSSMAAFEPFLLKLESLSESSIAQIVDAVPDDWGMAAEEARLLKELINTRKGAVRQIIEPHLS